ncbi:MAG: aminotransferase class V-fold PLP-dependent enzyme [Rhodospirillaceae bacterium]|nr:MAG: aminotransferase class V-fold PLP-dependent enzyme [Rhodospirillaceae bacterium]
MISYGASLRSLWPLDPTVTYLNHGGYGATPHEVLAVQTDWRQRIEKNPTRFMTAEYPAAIRHAAGVLAGYVGAAPDDVVFIDNATSGCNAVLRSLDFRPGDEILIANLAYGAIIKAARYVADRTGATLMIAELPLPVSHEDDVVAAFAARLSDRTRLVVLDHIFSPTGLVVPVRRLSDAAHAVGARVLIDGAHVPGNLALNVIETGADWYVGNCHKWLFAPRACGFLWATGAAREAIHPLAISHGYGQGMTAEFDWTGTRDPSTFLSVPAGIAFHDRLGGPALMTRNTGLASEAARRLVSLWNTEVAAPPGMCAAMAAIRLPLEYASTAADAVALRTWLSEHHKIEVALSFQGDAAWVRIAAQAYNEPTDYDTLAGAIAAYGR